MGPKVFDNDPFKSDSNFALMFQAFFSYFKPTPPKEKLSSEEIEATYPRLRFQILESTFIGYSTFYFVRNNLPVVAKEMQDTLGYTKDDMGNLFAATAISYGLGKFFMGILSDKSNPRKFMSFGLMMTALINLIFGSLGSHYEFHLILWTLNGFIQGMGWPPCGKSLGYWYSFKERGTIFAIWNIAHNVGGGLIGVIAAYSASFFGWRFAFFVPAILSILCSIYLFNRLKDTPESEGLPPIEEFSNPGAVVPTKKTKDSEESAWDLFREHVLFNKAIWIFAFANFFVYMVRYSLIDWGPIYLREVKGATLESGGISTLIYEFAGIGSTILIGWLSDKFGGKRGLVSFFCLIPILFAFAGIYFNPPGKLWLDLFYFGVIGFFIYPPVMLLGVAALDFSSQKAVGTAAGFVGLFGYLGRTAQGKALGWVSTHYTWNDSLQVVFGACIMGIILLAFTWGLRPKT